MRRSLLKNSCSRLCKMEELGLQNHARPIYLLHDLPLKNSRPYWNNMLLDLRWPNISVGNSWLDTTKTTHRFPPLPLAIINKRTPRRKQGQTCQTSLNKLSWFSNLCPYGYLPGFSSNLTPVPPCLGQELGQLCPTTGVTRRAGHLTESIASSTESVETHRVKRRSLWEHRFGLWSNLAIKP